MIVVVLGHVQLSCHTSCHLCYLSSIIVVFFFSFPIIGFQHCFASPPSITVIIIVPNPQPPSRNIQANQLFTCTEYVRDLPPAPADSQEIGPHENPDDAHDKGNNNNNKKRTKTESKKEKKSPAGGLPTPPESVTSSSPTLTEKPGKVGTTRRRRSAPLTFELEVPVSGLPAAFSPAVFPPVLSDFTFFPSSPADFVPAYPSPAPSSSPFPFVPAISSPGVDSPAFSSWGSPALAAYPSPTLSDLIREPSSVDTSSLLFEDLPSDLPLAATSDLEPRVFASYGAVPAVPVPAASVPHFGAAPRPRPGFHLGTNNGTANNSTVNGGRFHNFGPNNEHYTDIRTVKGTNNGINIANNRTINAVRIEGTTVMPNENNLNPLAIDPSMVAELAGGMGNFEIGGYGQQPQSQAQPQTEVQPEVQPEVEAHHQDQDPFAVFATTLPPPPTLCSADFLAEVSFGMEYAQPQDYVPYY